MLCEASKTKRILVNGFDFSFSACPWQNPPERKTRRRITITTLLFKNSIFNDSLNFF